MDAGFAWLIAGYEARLAGLDAAACGRRPAARCGCWSRHEVVEHLMLTYAETQGHLAKYRLRGRATGRAARPWQWAARCAVMGTGRMPRGMVAPPFVRPGHLEAISGGELCARLRERLGLLDEELTRCEESFGGVPIAPHFLMGPLTVAQWRRFHFVHGRHHLKQIDRIARALGREQDRELGRAV